MVRLISAMSTSLSGEIFDAGCPALSLPTRFHQNDPWETITGAFDRRKQGTFNDPRRWKTAGD